MRFDRAAWAFALVASLAACSVDPFVDHGGEQMTFGGIHYFGQTATGVQIARSSLIPIGHVSAKTQGYAGGTQVYALPGVDPSVAVVMDATEGAGGDYLIFTTEGALSSHRYDSIAGLCDYVTEASRAIVGCDTDEEALP